MEEELSVLQSIYLDDLDIIYDEQTSRPISLRITIFSNGDENDLDEEKRLLCTTLIADLPESYPDIQSPIITFSRSRGLTDEQLKILNNSIQTCLENNHGSCVLYECIELIRSQLSSFEIPSENCAICLSPISDRNDVIKTSCHHYYHRNCLASYVHLKKSELEEQYQEAKRNGFMIRKNFLDEIEDPVCRQILTKNILDQLSPLPTIQDNDDDEDNSKLIKNLSPHIRIWQQQMNQLFQQQKEKGGIIDLDHSNDLIFNLESRSTC